MSGEIDTRDLAASSRDLNRVATKACLVLASDQPREALGVEAMSWVDALRHQIVHPMDDPKMIQPASGRARQVRQWDRRVGTWLVASVNDQHITGANRRVILPLVVVAIEPRLAIDENLIAVAALG